MPNSDCPHCRMRLTFWQKYSRQFLPLRRKYCPNCNERIVLRRWYLVELPLTFLLLVLGWWASAYYFPWHFLLFLSVMFLVAVLDTFYGVCLMRVKKSRNATPPQ